MLNHVLVTIGLHRLRESAVCKEFPQGTFSLKHSAIYRHARIHLQHTEYLAAKFLITRLLYVNASKYFELFYLLLHGEVDPELSIVEFVSHHHLARRIYQLSLPPEYPVSSILVCVMRLLLLLLVGNKKFTRIFEGNNITTQPWWSISPDRHIDFRL